MQKNIFGTTKRVKLGLWGLGRGAAFINSAKKLGIDVVAGCDFNEDLRKTFKGNCPDAFITDNEDDFLAQDFDAVLVATWFFSHTDHAIKAMGAGKHVLSEVTSFFTPAEGVRLVEAVEKYDKVYNLAENYPFRKTDLYVKSLWDKGLFGELQYAEFQYVHDCRSLGYYSATGYNVHPWRSWLNTHYYNTHSLGPAMFITGTRPVQISAPSCKVHLAGMPLLYGDEEKGSISPSFIEMSNGGLVRNLMGTMAHDSHSANKIWGSRAYVNLDDNMLALGANGTLGNRTVHFTPEWPMLAEEAEHGGHGGGDFWVLYYFAREILTGEKAFWDIYNSCDCTLAGIMAVRSQMNNGAPVEVPDFRDSAVRDKYRNDHLHQTHFDPENVFPAGHDKELTKEFGPSMRKLIGNVAEVRHAFDGISVYDSLAGPEDKYAVISSVKRLIKKLPEINENYEFVKKLTTLYPDCDAAQAIETYLEIGETEKIFATEETKQELLDWLLEN